MILDERNELADAASVAMAAGTAVIGDVIDLGSAPTTQDIAGGEDLYIVLQTDTAIITGGVAGTIQFFVVSDSLATLGSATVASCTTHLQTSSLATAGTASGALAAGGTLLVAKLPPGSYERYLGVLCTVGTTTTTAGKINAFLTKNAARWAAYPDAL